MTGGSSAAEEGPVHVPGEEAGVSAGPAGA